VRYNVIYMWRGERHVHSRQCVTVTEADELVAAMRRVGWRSWYEEVP